MLVRILKHYPYGLSDQPHLSFSAEAGEVIDLPDYRALSCIAAGYGERESSRGPIAAPMTKPAGVEIAKAAEPEEDAEPEPTNEPPADFTILPKIGQSNAAAIIEEGITTYGQLFELMQSEQGKQFLINLPRVQPKHLPEIENALMSIVLGADDE